MNLRIVVQYCTACGSADTHDAYRNRRSRAPPPICSKALANIIIPHFTSILLLSIDFHFPPNFIIPSLATPRLHCLINDNPFTEFPREFSLESCIFRRELPVRSQILFFGNSRNGEQRPRLLGNAVLNKFGPQISVCSPRVGIHSINLIIFAGKVVGG